jgi:hypothetical protein
MIDAYLEKRYDGGQEQAGLIHASWLGMSAEDIYNRLMGLQKPGKPIGARTRRLFDDGLDSQRRYIKYFREMGILYEPPGGFDEDRGIRVVSEEYGIIGNVDAVIHVPEGLSVPVELKAYNSMLYKKYLYHPRIEHIHQLQVYIFLMNVPFGYLLPECKDNQEINPIKVIRDEAMINSFLSKATQVWERIRKELDAAPVES